MTERPATSTMVATRLSLHRVAEHVLSAARKRATGAEISLLPAPEGFCTPAFGDDARVISVRGTDIQVTDRHRTRRAPLTTVRAAAELVGIEPGFPWTKHPPGTTFDADEPLPLDPSAAEVIADWFRLGDESLRQLARELEPGRDHVPVIYPEHFDLAIAVAGVNYGASPGDADIPSPYLYVGPHEGPPSGDPYWNAPFGAFAPSSDVGSTSDATAFFRAGQARIGRP